MKEIDFSTKHHILIRNDDGSYQPMDEPYFRSEPIARDTWKIISDGDYSYLLAGDNEGMLVDTGCGCGNIREFCETLCGKPVRKVAITHDHFDHTANCCYFDLAYMSTEAAKTGTKPFPGPFDGIKFPNDYPKEVVGDGYIIDLGNREVEVFEIPDHSISSVAFLDKRERILFTGDELGRYEYKEVRSSVAQFARNMEKLAARRSEYDRCLGGAYLYDGKHIDALLACAKHILEGNEGYPYYAPDPKGPVLNPNPALRPTFVTLKDPEGLGRKVYARRLPQTLGDMYKPDDGHRFLMDYGGAKLVYDCRRIFE